MKYIDADKVKEEIDRLKAEHNGSPESVLNDIESFIDDMQQDYQSPPGIENEKQKKGWLDYGLTIDEIGLHRYNAINRIKEHKEQFDPLVIPDLYHVSEYYESVGIEKVMCCLQAWCRDFRFTQAEVKDIIEKEGCDE